VGLGAGSSPAASPGENWNLRFKFYDGGDAAAAYREPTGKPGLAAWAVINPETGRFLSVRFFHRAFPT
jgi:hypothetical protein